MHKFTVVNNNFKQHCEDRTTRQRMIIAFLAGIAFTVALSYIPGTDDISTSRLKDESAVPVPVKAPDLTGHENYELVYTSPEATT